LNLWVIIVGFAIDFIADSRQLSCEAVQVDLKKAGIPSCNHHVLGYPLQALWFYIDSIVDKLLIAGNKLFHCHSDKPVRKINFKNIDKNYIEIYLNIFYLVKVMAYFCHRGWAHKVQEGMQAGQVWCSAVYWTTLEWRSFRWQSFWLVGVPERLIINNIWTCFVIITIDWWYPVVIHHPEKYGHKPDLWARITRPLSF